MTTTRPGRPAASRAVRATVSTGAAAAVALVSIAALALTAWAAVWPGDARPWTVQAGAAAGLPTGQAATPAPAAEVSTSGVELTATTAAPGTPPPAPRVDPAWVAATAAATGIPPVAVAAYADATLALGVEAPACDVGWTPLAGIGAIESGHGSHGGSVLGADGGVDPPIVGPALDGDGVAAIAATAESTAWHGDPVWDHAVGPLQFLPSTWRRWGADGDADGVADPQDLDDAALAAGRYLCAGGRDLGTGAGWQAAVFSYNHSDVYVADVLTRANGYAAATAGSG